MSYNIDNFKVKKLENLVIPMSALYGVNEDWEPDQPEIIDASTMEVEIRCGCDQDIKGVIKDKHIHVTKLDLAGEGSGSFMYYIFKDALKKSSGELEAILIWERGDSITKLMVKDGDVKDEPYEL